MIKFHNATGTDGQIIHIDEVTKDNRAEHYYIVGCGGEMSAIIIYYRPSLLGRLFIYIRRICTEKTSYNKSGQSRLLAIRSLTFIILYSTTISCNYTFNFGPSLLFINSYKYAGLCT